MSILSALDELKKVEKVKQTVINTPKPKASQPKIVQPIQPQLTAKQIADLQKMKQTKQADIEKKAKKDKADKLYKANFGTPSTPYGTKGNLKDSKGKNLPRVVNPVATGITTVVTGRTAEFLPGFKNAQKQSKEQFPKSYIAGQILGYGMPSGIATGITKGLVKGATKKITGDISKRVVEGAIIGTTAEATQIVKPLITKEITPEQATKQLATGLVAGAKIDVALGVLGKVLKALPKDTISKIKSGITLNSSEKNNIIKELGLPKGTTADDYIRQMQDLAKSEDIINIPKQREADKVEQYYKSLEKEAPTQQQIVKPIIAQEQSLVKPITQSTERPKTIVKPLIEPTVTPQIKTPVIEPQYVKNIAENMIDAKNSIEVPLDTVSKEKFRRTTEYSVKNSQLPDDLKQAVKGNTYKEITNQDSWDKAWDKVSNNLDGVKSRLKSKSDLSGANDTMEYIALLNKTARTNIAEAKELAEDFAEKATRGGQAIQAISTMQKLTPEGQLVRAMSVKNAAERELANTNPAVFDKFKSAKNEIEKSIKNADTNKLDELIDKFGLKFKKSEEKTTDAILSKLYEKYKIPYFNDEESKFIVDTMENASELEGRKKALEMAKVDQLIADKTPASLWDKGIALRNMNLLGTLKTLFARNPAGNLIFMGLENVSQIPSGLADIATSKALGTERATKVLPSIGTQLKGMGTGVKETFEDMINNVDTSPTRGGAELPRNRKVFKTEALNKVNNFIGDMLKLGDRPFYQAAFDLRVKELKELRPNMSDEEVKALANAIGLERTFQNETVTSRALRTLKKDVLNLGKEHGLGDIVIPYSQTPANILQKGVEYTPLNALNVAGKLLGQGLGKETIRNNPKAFTDAIGRTFTGTSLMALGYNFMKNGYISGGTSEMSPKEKALNKEMGTQQYSIKIGDKWYSYDWSQPASIPLAVGADMYQSGMKEEDFLKQLESGFTGGIQTLFNQSVMQGVLRMFGSNTIAGGLLDAASGAPSQFVPTLGSQVAQTADKYKRDTDYSNVVTTAKTSVQKKIPGLRQQLPTTISMFGEPVEEQGKGVAKALKVFLSPSNVSDETTDKITKDIYNLYKRTGETDVIPSKMPTGLSKEQEREFKITFGKDVKSNIEKLMSGSFDSLPDDRKVKLIKNAIDDAYSRSKDKLGIGKK